MAKNNNTPTTKPDNTASNLPEKNITDNILNRIKTLQAKGGISFHANYSYENALKSAWLMLQHVVDRDKKPVLSSCTPASIGNTLFDMVIQGLNPAKRQCYFVPFANQLSLMRSYLGTIAVTKRLADVKDVFANVIYDGDDFVYKINPETGVKEIIKHEQDFKNINPAKILGAYAVITRVDLPPFIEIMNFEQIKKAWNQGAAKGNSGAHTNFADEMAKKSVINRACKLFFNTSDDSDLLIEAINRTGDNEYSDVVYEENVTKEIQEHANKQPLDIQAPAPAEEKKNGKNREAEPAEIKEELFEDQPDFAR